MTSKEFNRRVNAFKELDTACALFTLTGTQDFIYRYVLLLPNNVKKIGFTGVAQLSFDKIVGCVGLYFDAFTYNDFLVQFKYFKAFYNRCSQHQKDSIFSNNGLVYLVDCLNDNT